MNQARLEERVTQAWFGEYFHRLKHLSKLEDVLKDLRPKEKVEQTVDEMINMAKMLNAKFGGNVKERENEMAI